MISLPSNKGKQLENMTKYGNYATNTPDRVTKDNPNTIIFIIEELVYE
jgi:hypothetical protein